MEIFWIKDKKRCGPTSVRDIVDRVRLGELHPETLGWHAGMKDWKPLRDLPALADFLQDEPDPDEEEKDEEAPNPWEKAQEPPAGLPPKPDADGKVAMKLDIHLPPGMPAEFSAGDMSVPPTLARILARTVDTLLYLVLALGILCVAGATYSQYILPGSPFFWLPMILLEAFCLSKWHTTPGKRLMGIYIGTLGNRPEMSFGRAFLRSFMVYILGMGMMSIPFFPIMPVISYFALRKRGISWWDMRVLSLPIAKKEGLRFTRILVPLALIYACMVAAGVFMKPWYKPMYEEIRKVDSDMGKLMLQFIPELQGEATPEKPVPQPLD